MNDSKAVKNLLKGIGKLSRIGYCSGSGDGGGICEYQLGADNARCEVRMICGDLLKKYQEDLEEEMFDELRELEEEQGYE